METPSLLGPPPTGAPIGETAKLGDAARLKSHRKKLTVARKLDTHRRALVSDNRTACHGHFEILRLEAGFEQLSLGSRGGSLS
jgi:hypothetical protein